jgi:hypothetical protein
MERQSSLRRAVLPGRLSGTSLIGILLLIIQIMFACHVSASGALTSARHVALMFACLYGGCLDQQASVQPTPA